MIRRIIPTAIARSYFCENARVAGALAQGFSRRNVNEGFVFAPAGLTQDRLLDLDTGGAATQASSDLCLVHYLAEKYRNQRFSTYVIEHDPFAMPGDLSYAGASVPQHEESVTGNYFVLRLVDFDLDVLGHFRDLCVGFVKFLYVGQSDGNFYGAGFDDLCSKSYISEVFVNCFDDESWLGLDLTM